MSAGSGSRTPRATSPRRSRDAILERWLDGGYFHPDAEGSPDENFSIAIPPPNVTGALHMGHALNGTVQDVLTRLNRMRGRNSLWALGLDHAGIATQAVVERELREEGKSRQEIGREAFVKRVWEWRERYGSQIVEQYKRLGASATTSESGSRSTRPTCGPCTACSSPSMTRA